MKRRLALVALVLLFAIGVAEARPGGGESYSGGGGHGGGGGGGGGGEGFGAILELVFHLVRLCFYYPKIGLPLLALIIGYFVYSSWKQHKNKDWDSGPPVELQRTIKLDPLRRIDPDFSQPTFEDFLYRLFSTAHRSRHSPNELAKIAPYVNASARGALATRPPPGVPVESVVIGAMRIVGLQIAETPDEVTWLNVELEANTTTQHATFFTVERWTLMRSGAARTKPPDPGRRFVCPNCGAPWESTNTSSQQCTSCNEIVDNGRFDWQVSEISLRSMDQRPPTLTNEVEERGTDLPTYRAPGVDGTWTELEKADPAITGDSFHARLYFIYDQLNKGYSQNDLSGIRGLVSDGMYDYLAYWTSAYDKQGLRNVLEKMRITRTELAKITRDRYYDAVTVRIFATGLDYVVKKATNDVVKGSKRAERPYSEYWTLVRSSIRKGPAVSTPNCSNCGAPLKVDQGGKCEYCNAHVSSGEFDWVLSKIEQDDSYRG